MLHVLSASLIFPFLAWSLSGDSGRSEISERVYHLERSLSTKSGSERATLQLIFFHTKDVRLKVIDFGDASGPAYPSFSEAFRAHDCVAGVNGGFFHPDFEPSGLMIEEGKRTNKFESARLLSGVVYADGQGIHIVRRGEFKDHPEIRALIQTGPFLVDGGKQVAGLSASNPRKRTFIATDYRGHWVLGLTSPLTLAELGEILAVPEVLPEWPVNRAINLDGGSSCGMWFDRPDTSRDVSVTPWKRVRNLVGISLR